MLCFNVCKPKSKRVARLKYCLSGDIAIAQDKSQRLNEMITAPQVRLIGVEKEPLGIVTIAEALRMADEAELDLVEISPLADPPVCRIMDIGKFKYAESKKLHEAKLKQKQVQIKEIKFRPNTDEGDYNIKLRNLIKFLGEGDQSHAAFSRTRDGSPGNRHAFDRARKSGFGRVWRGGAISQDGRSPDGDGVIAKTEEEGKGSQRKSSKGK